MTNIQFSFGEFSDKGIKDINQDAHGILVPDSHQQLLKGIALAVADGISSSSLSHIASNTAINSFFNDYFCTPDAWSVKKSGLQVLQATNAWLNSLTHQSQFRFDKDRGYVCTFSALVIKSGNAHIFQLGDSRVYRIRNRKLELLTQDHRINLSQHESLLARALGMHEQPEIDYKIEGVDAGDIFLLTTDGVHEHLSEQDWFVLLDQYTDLQEAAKQAVNLAFNRGSKDNLTCLLFRVDQLGNQTSQALQKQLVELPFAPQLSEGDSLDEFDIIKELKITNRSYVYLAKSRISHKKVVLKFPSTDLRDNPDYVERLLMEEWIARRLNSPFVLKHYPLEQPRSCIYVATEFVEAISLSQWILDNPDPTLETLRDIIEQISKGLTAFHRMEMLHQDIRLENILIDRNNRITIIDFGSTQVAGIVEIDNPLQRQEQLPGTALFMAPEYFLGQAGMPQSDQFSLAVIAYYLLSGKFPYGPGVAKARTQRAQDQLTYNSVLQNDKETPAWMDFALRKALQVDPYRRYQDLSEFVADLRRPSQQFLQRTRPALIERNPVGFWQGVSLVLLLLVIYLAVALHQASL